MPRMRVPTWRVSLGVTVAAAIVLRTARAFKLREAGDYEVRRNLLNERYPAFGTFKGSMHAGLMPAAFADDDRARDDYSSYFFWLLRPDAAASPPEFRDDALVVWFNGGPGCSSLVGMLGEMGPVGVQKFGPGIASQDNPFDARDAPLVENPHAWTKKAAMLFVEQPGGTGFSTASTAWTGDEAVKRTEDDVASAFYAFLVNLYTVFGENLSQKRLYLAGESYAGMYIPSIAREIHRQNQRLLTTDDAEQGSPSSRVINLRGVTIGNGWIDVRVQGPAAIDYAWWHGMIDLPTYRGLHEQMDRCFQGKIRDAEAPFHPFTTPNECGINDAAVAASGGNFVYDVTTFDAYPDVLDEDGTVSNFLNDPDTRKALNTPPDHGVWHGCVPGAGRRRLEGARRRNWEKIVLDNDQPFSVLPYIAELLDAIDADIDILMYSGDRDMACSSQSTELSLESMQWSGKEEWLDPNVTNWHQWTVDEQPAGHTKQFKGLTFLIVYNSGHFVPINQPKNSLDMIGRLLDGKSFGDKSLPTFPVQKRTQLHKESKATPPLLDHRLTYLLIAVGGFLLGMLTNRFVFKRSHNYSPLP